MPQISLGRLAAEPIYDMQIACFWPREVKGHPPCSFRALISSWPRRSPDSSPPLHPSMTQLTSNLSLVPVDNSACHYQKAAHLALCLLLPPKIMLQSHFLRTEVNYKKQRSEQTNKNNTCWQIRQGSVLGGEASRCLPNPGWCQYPSWHHSVFEFTSSIIIVIGHLSVCLLCVVIMYSKGTLRVLKTAIVFHLIIIK